MLHLDNLVPFRPGLERVETFLGKRDGRVPEEEVSAAELPILPSAFLTKTLEKETLKITCFRDTFRPRQVRRYDRVSVVREVPAGRWGVLST